jgi:hypothetical protein
MVETTIQMPFSMISGGDLFVFLFAVLIVIVFFVVMRRFVGPPESNSPPGKQEHSEPRPH